MKAENILIEIAQENGFESDLHQTGFTRRVDVIESVNIELCETLFESYYN